MANDYTYLDFFRFLCSHKAMGRSGLAGSSMDGHLDMSHLQVPKHVGSPQDEPNDLEELEQFAKAFKQRRIKLGFTQVTFYTRFFISFKKIYYEE